MSRIPPRKTKTNGKPELGVESESVTSVAREAVAKTGAVSTGTIKLASESELMLTPSSIV